MPHLILAIVSWMVLLIKVGKSRIAQWAISGIIGVALAVTVDSVLISYGLYRYEKALFVINGIFPVCHFFYTYASTILYLNWLPKHRREQIIYTIVLSTVFLVVEAIMHQFGAIIYLKWNLWYSYPVILFGLSFLCTIASKFKLYLTNA